jgi:hypothetical protein
MINGCIKESGTVGCYFAVKNNQVDASSRCSRLPRGNTARARSTRRGGRCWENERNLAAKRADFRTEDPQ